MNKVVGNIHLSPGRSFRSGSQNIYELVPYLKEDGNRHDFTHTIHEFAFAGDDEYNFAKADKGKQLKKRLGIMEGPLDGTTQKVSAYSHAQKALADPAADVEAAIHVPVLLEGRLDPVPHSEWQKCGSHGLTSTCAQADPPSRSKPINIVPHTLSATYLRVLPRARLACRLCTV